MTVSLYDDRSYMLIDLARLPVPIFHRVLAIAYFTGLAPHSPEWGDLAEHEVDRLAALPILGEA